MTTADESCYITKHRKEQLEEAYIEAGEIDLKDIEEELGTPYIIDDEWIDDALMCIYDAVETSAEKGEKSLLILVSDSYDSIAWDCVQYENGEWSYNLHDEECSLQLYTLNNEPPIAYAPALDIVAEILEEMDGYTVLADDTSIDWGDGILARFFAKRCRDKTGQYISITHSETFDSCPYTRISWR